MEIQHFYWRLRSMLIQVDLLKSNKVQISWEGQKDLKKSPTLLWTYHVIKKKSEIFQILWPSHNILTLPIVHCVSLVGAATWWQKKSHVINVLSKPFLFPPYPMLVQIHYIHSAKRFSNWNKRALRNKELKCLLFPPSPNKPSRSMSSLSCWILK